MLLIIPLLLFDLCLAGYSQSCLISTVLPYLIIQISYWQSHQFWPKILLSTLALLLESFIRYTDQTPTLILILLSFGTARYLNLELNSRRLTSFLLLWLYLGLLHSSLVMLAWRAQLPPIFHLPSFLLELISETVILALLLQIPGMTKKNRLI
ncbi:MAG TPA: hypothetical protein VJJ83_03355 [Candidatus Babeliales bacterium]|nr:hypothetical protein [Candidatus Babeliales bacterium]